MERQFFIICLKRSRFTDSIDMGSGSPRTKYISEWFNDCDIVYWRPNRQGYTHNQAFAGQYTLDEVKYCAGSYLDWFLVPVNQFLEDEE